MPRFSANLSIMFTELPFEARFDAAARAGFRAVEFWFPYEWPAARVAGWARDAGVAVVGINSSPGDPSQGDWGLASDPARRDAFRASIAQALEYAQALGAPGVHVMSGAAGPAGQDPATSTGYLENIAWAAAEFARAGKTVLLEPLNPFDRPGYLLWRQAQARAVIAAVGASNVKVMYDLYHAQMTEGRLVDNLREHGPLVGHIQVADVPGRHEPGSGEVNWANVFAAIEASGYGGWIGCEYKPAGATLDGLGWLDRWK